MREVKFRAWLKNRSKLCVVLSIYFDKSTTIVSVQDGVGKTWFELGNKNAVLMQYTGLKDKHDKEIYEGDVLRVTNAADEVNTLDSDTGIGAVEWLDKWGFWNISNIENGLGDILNCGYVEIIGNIYEKEGKNER